MVDIDVLDAAAEVLRIHLELGGQRRQAADLQRPRQVQEPLAKFRLLLAAANQYTDITISATHARKPASRTPTPPPTTSTHPHTRTSKFVIF